MHSSNPPTQPAGVVCVAENRASCEPALRILVASLHHCSPGLPVILFCPNATDSFAGWVARYPQCALNPCSLDGTWTKYDIKPLALLTVLRSGTDQAIWLDSDILIARDIRPLFDLPPDTIAVTEEALSGGYHDPDGLRARLWGYPVGRVLPFAANTGVVRVTLAHLDLLEAWRACLESPAYREAQERPWFERPLHVQGDQEVFTALLSSERFARLPIRFLRRGRDIIQFFGSSGFTLRERFRTLVAGLPMFVHSQGYRPWWPAAEAVGVTGRLAQLYNDLSPYTTLARRHAEALADRTWLRPRSLAARLLTTRHPALTGLPVAVLADLARWSRLIAARLRPARNRARNVTETTSPVRADAG